jgi:hypothetical protein
LLWRHAQHHDDAMATTNRSPHEPRTSDTPVSSTPLELWHVRGASDDLRGLAIETSFGYALGLELDRELVLLHLQPSLDVLVAYADRIKAALLAQGWQPVTASPLPTQEHS